MVWLSPGGGGRLSRWGRRLRLISPWLSRLLARLALSRITLVLLLVLVLLGVLLAAGAGVPLLPNLSIPWVVALLR